jgi:imidazolonepropionase-like amidohydrolase
MPAIIDTHTHLSREREALVQDLKQRAYWGVGVAISLGRDGGDLPFQIRSENISDAALFRTAGRGISAPEPGRDNTPYWVTTEAEARKAVQELAAKKVDLVKIWVDDRNGAVTKLSPELYRAVIDEAHKHGLRATAHLFTLDDAKELLRAGIDAFAHGVRDRDVDAEFLKLAKERNVIVAPNLPTRGVPTDFSWLRGRIPEAELQKLEAATSQPDAQKAFAIQARNLAKLSQEGVQIALGTDGNIPWAPHQEMEDMVAAGMTPAQVIVAATRNGAQLLRMQQVGTLEVGKSADFIVLDANPLENITNTRTISAVYLRGDAVERPALSVGAQPSRAAE